MKIGEAVLDDADELARIEARDPVHADARGAHRFPVLARLDARQLVGIIEYRLADLH